MEDIDNYINMHKTVLNGININKTIKTYTIIQNQAKCNYNLEKLYDSGNIIHDRIPII